jgi:hypothetical protein
MKRLTKRLKISFQESSTAKETKKEYKETPLEYSRGVSFNHSRRVEG